MKISICRTSSLCMLKHSMTYGTSLFVFKQGQSSSSSTQQAPKKNKSSGGTKRKVEDDNEVETILDVTEGPGGWREFSVKYKGNVGTGTLHEKHIEPGMVRAFMQEKQLREEKEKQKQKQKQTADQEKNEEAGSTEAFLAASSSTDVPVVANVTYREGNPSATEAGGENGTTAAVIPAETA